MIRILRDEDILYLPDLLRRARDSGTTYSDVGIGQEDEAHVINTLDGMFDAGILSGVTLIDDDGFLAGVLLVMYGSTWYDRRVQASEMVFYIDQYARNYTTAMAMIRTVVAQAERRGAYRITAGSTIGYNDEAVKMLYRRAGFKDKHGYLEKTFVRSDYNGDGSVGSGV